MLALVSEPDICESVAWQARLVEAVVFKSLAAGQYIIESAWSRAWELTCDLIDCTTTLAPCSPRHFATAAPIEREEPVMMATLPDIVLLEEGYFFVINISRLKLTKKYTVQISCSNEGRRRRELLRILHWWWHSKTIVDWANDVEKIGHRSWYCGFPCWHFVQRQRITYVVEDVA